MILRSVAFGAGLVILSGPGLANDIVKAEGAAEPADATHAAARAAVPLVDWTVPQFLDAPPGISTSMTMTPAASGKPTLKTERSLSVFTAIPPCRLVDTRNAFSPAILSPGPFANGEVRTYTVVNKCGLPDATKGMRAISIAITTIPDLLSCVSGDVETVPTGTPLGNTVDMVAQANQWNSVSKIARLDASGSFDMQLRNFACDIAIDVNGYFVDANAGATGDFYSIAGTYATDGGLLHSANASAVGAAMRGFNSSTGADVRLAQGTNAIDIRSGQLRLKDAGVGTSTPAYIHQVTAGNLCTDTRYTRLDESHVSPDNGTKILFVQEAAHSGAADTSTPKLIRTVFLTSFACDGLNPIANSWYLFTDGTFAANETYNVLLFNP